MVVYATMPFLNSSIVTNMNCTDKPTRIVSAAEMEKSSLACGRLFLLSSQTMQSCPGVEGVGNKAERAQHSTFFVMLHCILENSTNYNRNWT